MKCPKCGNNQKKKYGTTCSKCKYKFVLSPDAKISDYAFCSLIQKLTKENTVYYTKHNLYSAYFQSILEKKKKRKRTYLIIGLLFLVLLPTPVFFVGIIGFAFCFIKWLQYKIGANGIEFNEIMSYLLKWNKSKNDNPFLISQKHLLLTKAPEKTAENDIFNYGLEGVVFVDNDYYVDWLILNNFHFTYRVAVLSINTYPTYLLPEIKQLIEENSLLPIYFLHDGKTTKTQMIEKLKQKISLENQKYLIDVGLLENDFMMVDFLKERKDITPFSKTFPLDTLQYSQLCVLFANTKSKMDMIEKTEEHIEDDIIMVDSTPLIIGGMESVDVNKREMDLDFG